MLVHGLFAPFRMSCALSVAILLMSVRGLSADELPDYSAAEDQLDVVLIDRHESAMFVAVRVDTEGRIFVGGRDTLFVYEPDGNGGYQPRQEIYRFPPESWVFDIEIRGHDLYVATASAVYLLPNAVKQRDRLQAKRLIWGQPLGHLELGFFGLAWGPEGDLYFSMGDPPQHYGDYQRPDHWGHWTFFSQLEGTRTPYTGVGAVLRCRPDGSQLQVVAGGIFRPCGLAFDQHWNLFTNDNDREAMPVQYVPARLLHVTPQAYFSWPRGWMVSKSPDRHDLLETMFGGLGREAPVGLAYYNEDFFPAEYRDQLLLARWAQRAISRFPLTRRGASFKTEEKPLLVGRRQSRPVGLAIGRGGRMFATILHMADLEYHKTKISSDLVMITTSDDPDTHPFDAYDAPNARPEKLWSELSDASSWRRNRAHVELLRRGGALLGEATRRLGDVNPSDPAMHHLPWLAAAQGGLEAEQVLVELANHSEASVRLQAIRALAERSSPDADRSIFVQALSDSDSQVRHAALLAFFDLEGPPPKQLVHDLACSKDTYLRQAATLLLARKTSIDELTKLCEADDSATRLAGVLAAGFRLTLPKATEPLPEHLPLSPFPESASVIQFADGKADLRKLGRIGAFTTAEHWQAGQHTSEQEQLFDLLQKMLEDTDESVRLQAAHFLSLLNDARSEPQVAKVVIASEEQRLAAVPASEIKTISEAWVVGPFPDGKGGLDEIHPPEQGAIDLAAQYPSVYPSGNDKLSWKQASNRYFDFTKLFGNHDNVSAYAYCRLQSARRQRILLFVGSNDGVKVWRNGQLVWKNEVVRPALMFQDSVFLDLQPGSNDLLVRIHNVTGESGMFLSFKALGQVVAVMPEKLDFDTLAQRLKAAGGAENATTIPAEFLSTDWEQAAHQGDPERGRKLFSADGLACAKCHAISANQQVSGGPSLAEAGKRLTLPHLVESILLPSKSISPVFRSTLIITNNGLSISGLVLSETADKIELLLPDGTRKTIPKDGIEESQLVDISPMPQGIVKNPDELSDLLAYLLSDQP